MLSNLGVLLPLLNLILVIGLAIGGIIAIRSGVGQTTSGMQARALEAQTAQIAAQTAQIAALEAKIEGLERALATVQELLARQYGLHMEINGELVTLVDEGTNRARTVRIHLEPPRKEEK